MKNTISKYIVWRNENYILQFNNEWAKRHDDVNYYRTFPESEVVEEYVKTYTESEEYILCAAIHGDLSTDMANEPLIYCGHRHHNILHQGEQVSRRMHHQGFLTNTGRFVDRKEAYKIAYDANQIIGPNKGRPENRLGLTSEDLY